MEPAFAPRDSPLRGSPGRSGSGPGARALPKRESDDALTLWNLRLTVEIIAPADDRAVRLDAAGVEEARTDAIEALTRRRVALAVLVRAPALDLVRSRDAARVRVTHRDVQPTGRRRRLHRRVVAPTEEVSARVDAARLGRARAQLRERDAGRRLRPLVAPADCVHRGGLD